MIFIFVDLKIQPAKVGARQRPVLVKVLLIFKVIITMSTHAGSDMEEKSKTSIDD